MTSTSIEWTEEVWNPVRGCTRVSEGCRNCYAERQAIRQAGPGRGYEGLVESTPSGPRWTGAVRLVPSLLAEPLRWRRPRRIFANSMSDLFHEGLRDDEIDAVFAVMLAADWHQFQVLTKRPERAYRYLTSPGRTERIQAQVDLLRDARLLGGGPARRTTMIAGRSLPLPNVWLGVSVEDQATANERIPILLRTPAAIRWISAEPLLDAIRLDLWLRDWTLEYVEQDPSVELWRIPPRLDWVVVGGESGPRARLCDRAWIRQIVGEAIRAGVPLFVKQLGSFTGPHPNGELVATTVGDRLVVALSQSPGEPEPTISRFHRSRGKGGDPSLWPAELRFREFPRGSPR